jgi:hypothetical protein
VDQVVVHLFGSTEKHPCFAIKKVLYLRKVVLDEGLNFIASFLASATNYLIDFILRTELLMEKLVFVAVCIYEHVLALFTVFEAVQHPNEGSNTSPQGYQDIVIP